jgi:membrane-associated protease RseP (regulator of RpoE activity)
MSEFLGSIWWLLVALGLLITFHEFGHFWVALDQNFGQEKTAVERSM